MSKKSRIQLFAEKTTKYSALLGEPRGLVVLDNQTGLHFKLFEHGIIRERIDTPDKDSDLIYTYGRLFDAWWGN